MVGDRDADGDGKDRVADGVGNVGVGSERDELRVGWLCENVGYDRVADGYDGVTERESERDADDDGVTLIRCSVGETRCSLIDSVGSVIVAVTVPVAVATSDSDCVSLWYVAVTVSVSVASTVFDAVPVYVCSLDDEALNDAENVSTNVDDGVGGVTEIVSWTVSESVWEPLPDSDMVKSLVKESVRVFRSTVIERVLREPETEREIVSGFDCVMTCDTVTVIAEADGDTEGLGLGVRDAEGLAEPDTLREAETDGDGVGDGVGDADFESDAVVESVSDSPDSVTTSLTVRVPSEAVMDIVTVPVMRPLELVRDCVNSFDSVIVTEPE